ncbi:hypothetical protein [Kineosporia sp. NBRC 101731]|uniref:hypothetical protein n=1 Tax=Kineosporia sp. NBRC 101731 TaxID=3032199 RepID=UPI0024A1671D|nr:hypothetical protein [Kineosporia sp. NBRC 101731]GLY28211.1 hypothetical protein Kisp02_15760 [Kineosporia sp. NBRC 101731]
MEPLSLILTAIVAGESKTESSTMLGAVEDDFASLHTALRSRLEGRPDAQGALEQYIAEPEQDKETLIAGLEESGAWSDPAVLGLAAQVMKRIDPEGSANGNYALGRA